MKSIGQIRITTSTGRVMYCSFRSRYRNASYYNVGERPGDREEVERMDDGTIVFHAFNSAITEAEAAEAVGAFEDAKQAEYIAWREEHAYLFA